VMFSFIVSSPDRVTVPLQFSCAVAFFAVIMVIIIIAAIFSAIDNWVGKDFKGFKGFKGGWVAIGFGEGCAVVNCLRRWVGFRRTSFRRCSLTITCGEGLAFAELRFAVVNCWLLDREGAIWLFVRVLPSFFNVTIYVKILIIIIMLFF